MDYRCIYEIKPMLDGLLGASSYLGEIVWDAGNGVRGAARFPRTHQIILVYGKTPEGRVFNLPRQPRSDMAKELYFNHEDERGKFCLRSSGGKQYKYYLDDGVRLGSVWTDIPGSLGGGVIRKKESTGYPTQKPEALLQRIVLMASNPGDLVLDGFAGSGTTLKVASDLKRRWVGFDIGSVAIETMKQRLTDYQFITLTD